jgi:acyl-CoA thioesterase
MISTDKTPLSAALALRIDPASPSRLHATIAADWAQGRATFGGLLGAQAVRALEQVSQGRKLRALTMSFSAPVAPGELEIEVELLRSGRALLHAQARLTQDGQVCGVVVGAFGQARPSPVRVLGEAPPRIPAPQSIEPLPFISKLTPTFTQHFDYRWASPNLPFVPGSQGQIGGWVRVRDIERVDTAALVAIADSFPAPVMPLMPRPAPSSTVTWMVSFVGESYEAPGEMFWQLDGTTLSAGNGYANVDARIWDADGTLRLISRQLIAEFSGPG